MTYAMKINNIRAVPMRLLLVDTGSSIGTGRKENISTFLRAPTIPLLFVVSTKPLVSSVMRDILYVGGTRN